MTWPRVVLLCSLCVGCGGRAEQDGPRLHIAAVGIEPDVELVPEPGRGAGTHIEYRRGGDWRFVFTCDTELSGYVCDYDLIASVEPPLELSVVRVDDFESDDYWYRIDRGAIRILAFTAFDRDDLELRSEAGAVLRVDVLLDGLPVPDTLAWATNGSVQTGAPTLPLEFVPEAP
jgi:hypothetical protein